MEQQEEKPPHVFVGYTPPHKKAGEYSCREKYEFLDYVLDQTNGEDGQLRDAILKAIGINRSIFMIWMREVEL